MAPGGSAPAPVAAPTTPISTPLEGAPPLVKAGETIQPTTPPAGDTISDGKRVEVINQAIELSEGQGGSTEAEQAHRAIEDLASGHTTAVADKLEAEANLPGEETTNQTKPEPKPGEVGYKEQSKPTTPPTESPEEKVEREAAEQAHKKLRERLTEPNFKGDYYDILGAPKDATKDELKAAFRDLAKKNHPDLHPDDPKKAENFKKINQAYETLSDEDKREKYDQDQRQWEQRREHVNQEAKAKTEQRRQAGGKNYVKDTPVGTAFGEDAELLQSYQELMNEGKITYQELIRILGDHPKIESAAQSLHIDNAIILLEQADPDGPKALMIRPEQITALAGISNPTKEQLDEVKAIAQKAQDEINELKKEGKVRDNTLALLILVATLQFAASQIMPEQRQASH